MNKEVKDVARSVHHRLVNYAHVHGEEAQAVLTRFAAERFLYRLGVSRFRDQFVLKGAMLLNIWGGDMRRPTVDMDLLGFGAADVASLVEVFREVSRVPAPDDGLLFDGADPRGAVIREGQTYEGVRISLTAQLGPARIPVQIDVGFGDPIVPQPREAEYPVILDLPRPRLRTYPPETVVAEKLQALVALGMLNSRTKDFYDLWTLSRSLPFDGETLCRAIRATFAARRTPLPGEAPIALTPAFFQDPRQQLNWLAFRRRLGLRSAPPYSELGAAIRAFLEPPLLAAGREGPFTQTWSEDGWQESSV